MRGARRGLTRRNGKITITGFGLMYQETMEDFIHPIYKHQANDYVSELHIYHIIDILPCGHGIPLYDMPHHCLTSRQHGSPWKIFPTDVNRPYLAMKRM